MREAVHDIVVVRLDLHQLLAHGRGIVAILRRTWKPYTTSHVVLTRLQVIELELVTERATGVGNEIILNDFRLTLLMRAAHQEQRAQQYLKSTTQSHLWYLLSGIRVR